MTERLFGVFFFVACALAGVAVVGLIGRGVYEVVEWVTR